MSHLILSFETSKTRINRKELNKYFYDLTYKFISIFLHYYTSLKIKNKCSKQAMKTNTIENGKNKAFLVFHT